MDKESALTAARLREVLDYNPGTGAFTWKVRPANNVAIGERAGGPSDKGYWRIRIDGPRYLAHRLAWLYVTGAWPCGRLDHRDRNGFNNAWGNLREATHSQNMANRIALRTSMTKIKGISFYGRNRWRASITMNGRKKNLGLFDCVAAAQLAYAVAAAKIHGEFARLR